MILQFAVTRTLSAVLLGTELILLLVALAYFAGFSAGYFLSDKLDERGLRAFAWAQWATHLTLPFSLRWLVGFLAAGSKNAPLLAAALFLGAFWVSSFYSILLPRLLNGRDLGSADGSAFARLYGLEVFGAACGIGIIFALSRVHPAALMTLYQAALVILIFLLFDNRGLALACAAAVAAYAAAFPRLERSSVAYYYGMTREEKIKSVLFTADTAYQRVEILEEAGGAKQLYLDGILHYGADPLSDFNDLIAGLPASLLRPADAVVVGSGSLEAAHRALAGARRVTSVELDPAVAAAGARFLSKPFSRDELNRWTLVIDDAKHYLGKNPRSRDMVVLDIAAPLQRQVALLYSREFLSLVRERLQPGGLVSLCLNGDFARGADTSRRIAATLLDVFEEVFVLCKHNGEPSFALAGRSLPFGKAELLRELKAAGRSDITVLDRSDIEARMRDDPQRPISMGEMDVVLRSSIKWLKKTYF